MIAQQLQHYIYNENIVYSMVYLWIKLLNIRDRVYVNKKVNKYI